MDPCQNCHAGCCRSFAVPVTGADILTIEKQEQLSFWDFVCRWADPDGKIARNYAPHFHFEDEPETPFTICLIHGRSQYFPLTSKCQFLVEEAPTEEHPQGKAHCGIYHSRPSACRAFPTKLNSTGELAVIHDVPNTARKSSLPIYDLCPREWEPADLDPIRTMQDLVVAKYEMAFFHKLAVAWNRRPQAWNLFPEFLYMVYGSRLKRENPLPEEDQGPTSNTRAA